MRLERLALLPLVLVPRVVEACASCITSPYGDQTYNWAYVGLMLVPFALVIGIGGVLTRCYLTNRRRLPAPTDSITDEDTV